MSLLRRFPVYTYVLVLLSIGGFALAEGRPAILILGGAVAGLSWWLVETPDSRPLPRWLINLGVLGALLLLFFDLIDLAE